MHVCLHVNTRAHIQTSTREHAETARTRGQDKGEGMGGEGHGQTVRRARQARQDGTAMPQAGEEEEEEEAPLPGEPVLRLGGGLRRGRRPWCAPASWPFPPHLT